MPDGKTILILAVAGILVAGAGKIVRVVHPVATKTKNATVKVVKHIHPIGAIKAVVRHQK